MINASTFNPTPAIPVGSTYPLTKLTDVEIAQMANAAAVAAAAATTPVSSETLSTIGTGTPDPTAPTPPITPTPPVTPAVTLPPQPITPDLVTPYTPNKTPIPVQQYIPPSPPPPAPAVDYSSQFTSLGNSIGDLKTQLNDQWTKNSGDFLKAMSTNNDTLKNDILSGVDTKNQKFGQQATQGFMDAFKNFSVPASQQNGVNLGNYNDNRNAAADQWWSKYVSGRR